MATFNDHAKFIETLNAYTSGDIAFDASKAPSGVAISADNRCITQTVSTPGYKCVYLNKAFPTGTGCHYVEFKILNRGASGRISIGISDGAASTTASSYPGHGSCQGSSFFLHDGTGYTGDKTISTGCAGAVTATTIGMLYNSDEKTLTFFADGVCVGMTAGADALTADTYYPVVTFYELGNQVAIDDY